MSRHQLGHRSESGLARQRSSHLPRDGLCREREVKTEEVGRCVPRFYGRARWVWVPDQERKARGRQVVETAVSSAISLLSSGLQSTHWTACLEPDWSREPGLPLVQIPSWEPPLHHPQCPQTYQRPPECSGKENYLTLFNLSSLDCLTLLLFHGTFIHLLQIILWGIISDLCRYFFVHKVKQRNWLDVW